MNMEGQDIRDQQAENQPADSASSPQAESRPPVAETAPAASDPQQTPQPPQAEPAPAVAEAPASPAPEAPVSPVAEAPGQTPGEEMSFAEMLQQHEAEEPSHGRFTPGQRVTVKIVAITNDTVFVSTGAKVDGIVDREELLVDGELPYQVGDALELYVVTATSQEVRLSKVIRGAGSLTALEDAKEAGVPVEGKVTAQVKGGYSVEIMKRRAFCPLSQMDLRPSDDPEAYIGKTLAFIITRLEKGGRNIVVSRRVLLEREQAENRASVLNDIHEGDVLEVTVTRLTPFGAFVELAPGVEGLVHISELSWSRISNADEAVSLGDRIRVKVLSIKQGEKDTRISLSAKQVMDDPWKDIADRLHAGDILEGKVVRTAPFGAFVEVLPGIEGLVHISELSYERRVNKTEDVVVAGDRVTVKVKDVDPLKKRISLSLRDVGGDPWDTVEDAFAVDQVVTGTMEKRAPFGFFVTLAPGITGLLPNAVLTADARKIFDKTGPGDAVSVRIKGIDQANKKISLGPEDESAEAVGNAPAGGGRRERQASNEEKDWKKHAPKTEQSAFGSLGSALQAALNKKK